MPAISTPTEAAAFDRAGFHEATVLAVGSPAPGRLRLLLDDVQLGERRSRVEIVFAEVARLTRDGRTTPTFGMEMPDGEVLTLRRLAGGFQLIVEWHDFATRRRVTAAYSFDAAAAELRVIAAE